MVGRVRVFICWKASMGFLSFMDRVKTSPKGSVLDELALLVDWVFFERKLRSLFIRTGLGRAGYSLLILFKILILQRL